MRIAWVRVWLPVLLVGCLAALGPGTKPASQEAPKGETDPSSFLDRVLKRYETAKTYHIELVEESQFSSDLQRIWERRNIRAVLLPDKRYRFEERTDRGWYIQMSDGVSEWIYLPQIGQYTKGPAPASAPGAIPNVPVLMNSLLDARHMLGKVSGPRGWIRSATYSADEAIDVNGQPVICKVVEGKGFVPGATGPNRKISTTITFWIDKKEEVIWKETEHREGPMRPDLPSVDYKLERTMWFKVSQPAAQTAPEGLFVFKPAEPAELVSELTSPRDKRVHDLLGKQAPTITLVAMNGKAVSLASYRGKPVLLDFWATWCAPCVESLPAMQKLYNETADKGLVVLSIDSDEDARTTTEFLAKRNIPWPNFHLTDEIAAAFPEHGIPYFVLVDASGKVAYSGQGLDEDGLRAAVAKLGPAFAAVSKTSQH